MSELDKEVLSIGLPKPEYVCVNADGPSNGMTFTMTCKIGEDLFTSGIIK